MTIFHRSIPQPKPADIVAWADSSGIKVDGHTFDSERTPQLLEPIRAMADADTRIVTLIKPVQIGGSTAGEVVCAYWAAFNNGLIQYNWQDDKKAEDRWSDRILPALESCHDIKRTGHRWEELICEARYVNTTVRCQGVFNESSLDSDTVPLQINEEVHLWKPGFLGKARRRQTQVWNAKAFDISNASNVGDQLQIAYEAGTMEQWEVLCPRCGEFHVMRFRFNPARPELGGLRWDSEGCKNGDRYNYNKLAQTIRYQFPCGLEIQDHPAERRRMVGRYSKPQNDGAHTSHRSFNFEAVACGPIRWLTLIQEWHQAIRSQKSGDSEPMRRFITERECRFYSEDLRPFQGQIILNTSARKSREGLPDRAVRLFAADKQKGRRALGQLSHYWLVIRDVMDNADSRLVYEGMVQTDADLLAVIDDHGCPRRCGCIDATWDTKNVMEFCYRSGINATQGSNQNHWFGHPDKVKRYYSVPKPIHAELNVNPQHEYVAMQSGWQPHIDEPMVWFYNKAGLLTNLFFLRQHGGIIHDVPADVSDDYQKQNDSWERITGTRGRSQEHIEEWRQTRADDHMLMCEGYIAMEMDLGGFISRRLVELETKP